MAQGGQTSALAALDLITNFSQGTMGPAPIADYSAGSPICSPVWKGSVDTAERFKEPGRFTAFIGYEGASLVRGNNMHRNVVCRDGPERGLLMEPMITQPPLGSTDTDASLSTAEEDDFLGKATNARPSPTRVSHPFSRTAIDAFEGYQLVASGYTDVRAPENTCESLWDAMVRRGTSATTGPRMTVRFFVGRTFDENDLRSRAPAFAGYEKGVPMGADLRTAPEGAGAPSFLVYVLGDPIGADPDRIRIIKGWWDSDGALHDQILDVAWSDGREPGADGKLPPVGNTVDSEAANRTRSIGASALGTVRTDPDFDPEQAAFCYARVLEIPTPRRVVHDKVRLGAEIPEAAQLVAQESAHTSAICYDPEG